MNTAADYQAINVTKDNAPVDAWEVVHVPTNEAIGFFYSEAQALAAIKRYRDADARRAARAAS